MEKYYLITHEKNDPYFNIASEEYLLKEKDGFYYYFWINEPSVIIGTNQNTIAEVNLSYVEDKGIKVVRRLTGGGAVYHDLNNLCYTVIAPYNENEDNYKKFTAPVIEYLNELGVKAEFSGRNDITVNGLKISGNAQTVYKDRIMHHGTLLFDTDVSVLSGALKPNKLKTESKGIKSIRARVTNIIEWLPKKMDVNTFKKGLIEKFSKIAKEYCFSNADLDRINQLKDEKYSTFDWNVGKSPKGKITFENKFDFGIVNFNFDVVLGKIENAKITGDFFSKKPINELEERLNGVPFDKKEVMQTLNGIEDYIVGATPIVIAEKLFN